VAAAAAADCRLGRRRRALCRPLAAHLLSIRFHSAACRRITDLKDLLATRERILAMVEEEAQEIADKHGDDRRTALVYDGASPRPLACPPSHAELARSL
jgi:hypothetical protein